MTNRPFRFWRTTLPVLLLALLLALASGPAATGQASASAMGRIVAVGDVHGDYDALVGILQQTGLIDAQRRWAGGNTTLVQTGDFLDRGPKVREVMDLLMGLEKQAPKKGGRVVVLLGNHEVMNLMGDLRFVTPENYASFADKNSEKRRAAAYQEYTDWQKQRAQALGKPAPALTPEAEAQWMQAHPPGFFEHGQAFGPTGKYGRWLREHPSVAQIGGTIFLHGGISPQLASWNVAKLNQRLRDDIRHFDVFSQYFLEERLILPFFDLAEISTAVLEELAFRRAALAEKAAAAAEAGKRHEPSPEEKRQVQYLEDFLGYVNWLSFHQEGPLWFRGYALWPEEEGAAHVASLLKAYGASEIVVGHTPQLEGGRIRSRFGGKVFLIDTGMLSAYYKGGRASALEINSGKFTAVYMDQRTVLLDPATPRVGGPANQEEFEEEPGGGLAQEPSAAPAAAAPPAKPARVWLGPDGQPLPFKTDEEVMEFLRTAKIVSMRDVGTGITNPRKVVLEKDGIRMHAIFHDVDEEKQMATLATGQRVMFFRDSFIFQVAAYELSRILGLDNVPPVVERRIQGKSGSLQIWVERTITYKKQQQEKIPPPDSVQYTRQIQVMRVFDALIHNDDRNMGNLLFDSDWKLWMIDHTRAFRRNYELREPVGVALCERNLWEKLRTLDTQENRLRLRKFLRSPEIDGMMKRRAKLIEYIEQLIKERGEERVLFTLDQKPAS